MLLEHVLEVVERHRDHRVAELERELGEAKEHFTSLIEQQSRTLGVIKTSECDLRTQLTALTKERDEANAKGQERVMETWLRCLGNQVYPKAHHIDALGKTTRKLTDDRNAAQAQLTALQERNAKLEEGLRKAVGTLQILVAQAGHARSKSTYASYLEALNTLIPFLTPPPEAKP